MRRSTGDLAGLVYGSLRSMDEHRTLIRGLAQAFASHHLSLQLDAADHRHLTKGDFDAIGVALGEMTEVAARHDVQSPWFASDAARRLPTLGVISDDATGVSRRQLHKSAFHRYILQSFDIEHSFVWYLGGSARGAMTLGVSRSMRAGPYSVEEMDTARQLLPHLRNVLAIQKMTAGNMLDTPHDVGRTMWVLSSNGSICSRRTATPAQHALIERHDQLVPVFPADRAPFGTAVRSVLTQVNTTSRLVLRDISGVPACVAHIHHCRREAFMTWLLPESPGAIVHVKPIERSASTIGPVLASVFGLTAAECRVAALLAALDSPRDIAAVLCRSEETVRSQIKAITAKTGTHSMMQLLKLLSALQGQ